MNGPQMMPRMQKSKYYLYNHLCNLYNHTLYIHVQSMMHVTVYTLMNVSVYLTYIYLPIEEHNISGYHGNKSRYKLLV